MPNFIAVLFSIGARRAAHDSSDAPEADEKRKDAAYEKRSHDKEAPDTIAPLEQTYRLAGMPFGPTIRALLLWIRFQQQTTAN